MSSSDANRGVDDGAAALEDVTVVIPYREDGPDRRRNLLIVLDYFERFFPGQHVLVVEQAFDPVLGPVLADRTGVEHLPWRLGGAFHKSRILNLGLSWAETPWCLVHDADALLHPAALVQAAAMVGRGEADFVYPFNHVMIQIRGEVVASGVAFDRAFFDSLPVCGPNERPADPRCEHLYGSPGNPCVGGALLCRRRELLRHGGYNCNIVSYGCEDVELHDRLGILGARVDSVPQFCCYHVEHARGEDSRYNNFYEANLAEWMAVRAMPPDELWHYVHNGFRRLVTRTHGAYAMRNTDREYSLSVLHETRPSLERVSLALYAAKPDEVRLALARALLDAIETRFSNYEVLLIEKDSERCRRFTRRSHVVFKTLAGNRSRWEELALQHCRRSRVALVKLGETTFVTVIHCLDALAAGTLPAAGTTGINVIERNVLAN